MTRPNDTRSRRGRTGSPPETQRAFEGRALEPELLHRTLFGANLQGHSLRDELGEEPTLLVFLRHFG